MSEEGKKISNVEVPQGVLESGRTGKDMELINKLKHKYIEKNIKITDDDPLIAILLGQDVLLEIYDMQISERINKRFDSLEQALSTFPVRVSEQLNERAENFLNLVEKIDSSVESHLVNELKTFQGNVRDYAISTENHLKSIKVGSDNKKADNISYAKVFAVSFISSALAVSLALACFYFSFLS
ncbi:hypothetical protein ACNCSK_004581 [Escherichia coli]|uniref:hypothetical protein n=1 Tax=Escherichia coli TaxID=562 RepID=UPI000FB2C597|nr:hypothetical protein [Escherichia coli]EBY7550167.1 hypothetical protein [Salmonella enterica subsp. enterica serovar Enteritidis]EDC6115507.1 hypothetical protein [Salmonella enterica subsp. enterica serovar Java]EFX7813924.1 hypothetical protein [Shigella sonnei]EGN9433488.1 hypothetical protein [Salmonella enterica]HDO6519872.1 hypothetical protein [Salmonella enterica subsp. enterica serovar Typhimurium]